MDTAKAVPAGAVEVTRTDGGVLLRTGTESPAVKISQWGWADFLSAVEAGEFDATLKQGVTFRTSDVAPTSTDVVEVTCTDDGVFLRVVPGTTAVYIPRQAWSGLLAGIYKGAFNHTWPGEEVDIWALIDGE